MMRRIRSFAGLVGTAAFTFSLAVGVWASVCAVDVEMGGSPMAMASDQESAGDAAPEHDCMEQHGPEDMAHCPFSPPGMNDSCTSAVSLPATAIGFVASPEDALLSPALESRPLLIVAAALFHPPKS